MNVERLDDMVFRKLLPESTTSKVQAADKPAATRPPVETRALPSREFESALLFTPRQIREFNPLNDW